MFRFIISLLLLIISVVIFSFYKKNVKSKENTKIDSLEFKIGFGLTGIAGLLILATTTFYTQDIGEAVVLRNFGGSLAGQSTEAGIHFKAPWQTALSWDIRNRQVNFYEGSGYQYDNGSYYGSEVVVNDKSGTQAAIDIQVIYSIQADSVSELYKEYGTQEAFVTNYVSNDIRATARETSGKFDTITLLTDRSQYAEAITKALEANWEDKGVIVEQVQVQAVVYSDSITNAYAQAQAAEVEKQKALNEQETAKVQAETKIIEAEAEAKANQALNESLTDRVLQQNYIDALKEIGAKGNLVVVPEGSMPMINTSTSGQ